MSGMCDVCGRLPSDLKNTNAEGPEHEDVSGIKKEEYVSGIENAVPSDVCAADNADLSDDKVVCGRAIEEIV